MEFFKFANVISTQDEIIKKLTLKNLPNYCNEIEEIAEEGELDTVVYFSHWGRFHIRCETVMGGTRYSIPDCPNALAWTVTTGYPPHPEKIIIHATINRIAHEPDFIEGVNNLISSLKEGLEKNFSLETVRSEPKSIKIMDLR